MKYRIYLSVEVEARHDSEAYEQALKLEGMLKSPLVKMATAQEGIRLAEEDGRPIVHAPLRT